MNKFVKGTIAGAIGITLLLGGAGTFALWNAQASLSGPSVTAGKLELTANSDGVWKVGTTVIDPTTYKIIPGQTLVYTQTLKVDAVGTGIKANLSHSGLEATGSLAAYTSETLEVTSPNAVVGSDTNTLKFAAGDSTVNVKLTVVLPDTVTGTQGQNAQLDLSGLTFTLAQTL